MLYTYVVWENGSKRWESFCPAWPGITGHGESQEACLAQLAEIVNGHAWAREKDVEPPIEDVSVQIGTFRV
jgi:predicted RNase H-like HicB family nuclease